MLEHIHAIFIYIYIYIPLHEDIDDDMDSHKPFRNPRDTFPLVHFPIIRLIHQD